MNNHRPWIHLLLSSAILLFIGNKHCISQAFSPSPCCCLRLASTTTSTSTTATTRLDASRSTFSKHPKDGSKSRGASSSSSCVTPIFQSMPKILPKLLVFDLDNTLWTPELYQIRQKTTPTPGKDIFLFPDAESILFDLANNPAYHSNQKTQLAIASRTHKQKWADALLSKFQIEISSLDSTSTTTTNNDLFSSSSISLNELFAHKQIVTGSKKFHFQQLQEQTGIPYRDMVFFDDDARMNLEEVSQLGVLCCHCPRGMTLDLYRGALIKYDRLKSGGQERVWMGYTITIHDLRELGLGSDGSGGGGSGSTTADDGTMEDSSSIAEAVGTVKYYSSVKRFGFIRKEQEGTSSTRGNENSQEEYFFHESKLAQGMEVQQGMRVKFEAGVDSRGRPAALSVTSFFESASTTTSNGNNNPKKPSMNGVRTRGNNDDAKDTSFGGAETKELPCFSMSQPFTALLMNGIKKIESRGNPMFADFKPGTKVLVHCGRRDWKDMDAPRVQLRKAGHSEDDIDSLMALPDGFKKGSIVGIVELGRTWETTQGERRREAMQRNVVAPSEDIGVWCTMITSAKWFERPLPATGGKPGIYNAKIPKDLVPGE